MRSKWIVIIGVSVWGLLFPIYAEEADTANFTGTVIDAVGTAIEGATLNLYLLTIDEASGSYRVRSMAETASDDKGMFSFVVGTEEITGYAVFLCLAQKKGLACGWRAAIATMQANWQITLGEPNKLIGFVQNPDGTAVADAEVRLVMLSVPGGEDLVMLGIEPIEAFVTKTCSTGRFEFNNLPADATVEFMVKKEGKGAFHTLDVNVDPEAGLTYAPGQADIMLTMSDACKISGTVINGDNQSPVANVRVMVREHDLPINLIHKPVTSDSNGYFTFKELSAGDYTVYILDDDWIAKSSSLTVTPETVAETTIELTKGGMLEVKVVDAETKEPVAKVSVNAQNDQTQEYQQFTTDENGLGSKQVLAGTYRISIYKSGFRSSSDAGLIVVENGKTGSLTVELGGQPKIKGLVTDMKGNPIPGAIIRLIPNWGSQKAAPVSDEKGQFTITWDPQRMGLQEREFYLSASHTEKNLVGILPISEETKEATVKLEPGINVKGRVIDSDGKPIVGARALLYFYGTNFGTSFGVEAKTDLEGFYHFSTLASEQRYAVHIMNAEGYGNGQMSIQLVNGVQESTIDDIILQIADQVVTGQVVDIDGKGLENVQLHCSGSNQPNLNVVTDKDGNFVLENVCVGEISISAYKQVDSNYLNSYITTEGGATDVIIILSDQSSSQGFVPKQPASLIGKPLGDLSDCGIDVPGDAGSMLVFVWDMNQRPSRYFIKQLTMKTDLLKGKGVTVMLIHASGLEKDKIDTWLEENDIIWPCGMVAENADDVLFKMGVRGLPWLILTDADHKVIAEGFSINELEDKLR